MVVRPWCSGDAPVTVRDLRLSGCAVVDLEPVDVVMARFDLVPDLLSSELV